MATPLENALVLLRDNWHVGIVWTIGEAATLIGTNPNTLKTRLARNQGMQLRDRAEGEVRDTIGFTGYHLVYNLIADRLAAFGFPNGRIASDYGHRVHSLAEWVFVEMLLGSRYLPEEIVAQVTDDGAGLPDISTWAPGAQFDKYTGDAALVLPLGAQVAKMALVLFRNRVGKAIFR